MHNQNANKSALFLKNCQDLHLNDNNNVLKDYPRIASCEIFKRHAQIVDSLKKLP